MGAIQSSINNALGTAAIAGGIGKHLEVQGKQAKLAEEKTTMEINIRNFLSCARIYTLCEGEDLSEQDVEAMIKEQMVNQSLRGGKSF